jgi:hypothetical protein
MLLFVKYDIISLIIGEILLDSNVVEKRGGNTMPAKKKPAKKKKAKK